MFKLKKKKTDKVKTKTLNFKQDPIAPRSGYKFTPSYIKTGKRYSTILKITNKYGMNRNQVYGWFIHLVPEITIKGVRSYLVVNDKPMSEDEQADIINKNVEGSTASNSYELGTENNSDIDQKKYRLTDYSMANTLDANKNPIIDVNILVMLVGDNPNAINYQIERLKSLYDDSMQGVGLNSAAGTQKKLLKEIGSFPPQTPENYTWMSADYAGNNIGMRKGLIDKRGWPIGQLAASYAAGSAFMDLDGTFKSKIMVAAPTSSEIIGYDSKFSGSSLWGQLIANNAMSHKHKTHHIVMNGFKYVESNSGSKQFTINSKVNKLFQTIDLSKGGLNPLEMFGEIDDIVNVFTRGIDKNVYMAYLGSHRSMTVDQQNLLRKHLTTFYINRKLWNENAAKNPERVRALIDIEDPTAFPTYGDLIVDLTNGVYSARRYETESAVDRNIKLNNVISNLLSSYGEIFNMPSTLPKKLPEDKYQFYYDLSNLIADNDILEAQFINTFDYIANNAKKGDIIMLHGFNSLTVETVSKIKYRIDRMEKDGIRVAYLFDSIGSGERDVENERANIFNTDGIIYESMEDDFDYYILGRMNKNEVDQYGEKIKAGISDDMKDRLLNADSYRYLVRRISDTTSSFIDAMFYI